MPLNVKCEEPPTPSVKSEPQPVDDEPDEKFITVSFVSQIYVHFDDLPTAKCLTSNRSYT